VSKEGFMKSVLAAMRRLVALITIVAISACNGSGGGGDDSGNAGGGTTTTGSAVTGTVTDATGNALANILIVVKTFHAQVLQGSARTDAGGHFGIAVPAGDYVVAAINDGVVGTARSQWW